MKIKEVVRKLYFDGYSVQNRYNYFLVFNKSMTNKELSTIISPILEKLRGRRYPSPNGKMAEHLTHNEITFLTKKPK